MATQVVELTGDEARLLRSLQNIITKEEQHRQKLLDLSKAGEKAGASIEGSLGKAGKDGEKAFDGISRNVKSLGTEGEKTFTKFGTNAIKSIGGIAAGWVSVQTAVRVVNEFLDKQLQLLDDARDRQLDLATAQQQALKNLSGLSVEDKRFLFGTGTAQIASQAGFGNTTEITQALGEVASTGISDAARIQEIVTQAARIEKTEDLNTLAGAAAAVQQSTNLSDIRESLGLVQTTAGVALVSDFGKLLKSLPKALGAGVNSVPGQDPVEASRQAAAVFSQATQGAVDFEGTSTATFAATFFSKQKQFFEGLEDERVKARSKIVRIDNKQVITEQDELEKKRLQEFLAEATDIVDPGTIFGRTELLQQNPAIRRQFTGEEGFGEQIFKPVLSNLLDPDSKLAEGLTGAADQIQASTDFFEEQARQNKLLTPQIALKTAEEVTKAGTAALETRNVEGAVIAQIRKTVDERLGQTTGGGASGFLKYLESDPAGEFLSRRFFDRTSAEEGVTGISRLLQRRQALASGGLIGAEGIQVEQIDADVRNIMDLLPNVGGDSAEAARQARRDLAEAVGFASTAPFGEERELAKEQVRLLEELVQVLSEMQGNTAETATASKTTATNTSTGPSFSDTQQAAR